MVKLLVEAKSPVDLADTKYGMTPLHWASQEGHTDLVRLDFTNSVQS